MDILQQITVNRRLPSKEEAAQCLLDASAKRECACGKRKFADQQEVLDVKVGTDDWAGRAVYMNGRMKCLVCKDVHKLQQMVYLSEDVYDAIME